MNMKTQSYHTSKHNVDFASFTLLLRDTGFCFIVRENCFSNSSNFCSIVLDLKMLF